MNVYTKSSIAVVGVVAAVTIVLNSYTIVQSGTAKVQSFFGTVNQTPLLEGFHIINPLSSIDEYDTRNQKYEVNNLNIPTQDRFNSTANITVLYRIDESKTPYIKQNYGTAEEYISKTVRQYLRSIIRDQGRKMQDSRSLAQSDKVMSMQENAKRELQKELDNTGITIQDLLVQDIKFDPRIQKQILDTQERIQMEQRKQSEERIAITNANIKKQEAIGAANQKRQEADAQAYSVTQAANAEKAAAIAKAEGQAKSIELIAKANEKLTHSLTPQILEKQRLDNEAILYSHSKGNVPETIIGDTNLRAIGVPVAQIK